MRSKYDTLLPSIVLWGRAEVSAPAPEAPRLRMSASEAELIESKLRFT